MRPVARGIAGGLLLSLVVVAGVTLLSRVGPSVVGSTLSDDKVSFAVSVTTTITAMSTTTTAAATTTGPLPLAALKSADTATSGQAKSSYSLLLTFLPVAAALALGASAYLISRSRIEKEA